MQLNNEQQAAVETTEKQSMILAGAGSGKTRVLTERIAHLVENCKVSPYEIIAFTFTRKAAGEMKQRLEDRLGTRSYGVTMATMHAIALKFIRRYGEQIGLRPHNVTVYGEWEEQFLLKHVATEMGIFKKSWKIPKKDIDAMFAEYYQAGILPTADDKGYKLFKYFLHRCKENNALTYGSLLIGMAKLLPEIRKYHHFKYVMVDEVQDIDALQWKIIIELTNAFQASLFVVGDIDQSIFEWRGATPEYLIEIQDRFKIYRLESNYRSGREIVEYANKLISYNQKRLPKTMRPQKKSDGLVTFCTQADSKALVDHIKYHMPQAVLSRTHILLQSLARRLDDAGIGHRYVGKKTKLVNSESFRRFHAFLKLMINPFDNFAFLLAKHIIGISNQEYSDIRYKSSQVSRSHFQQWAIENIGSKWGQLLCATPRIDFMSILTSLTSMIDTDGTDSEKWRQAHIFAEDWWNNNMNPEASITEYLDWLATYDMQDEMADDDQRMQLLTIHGAKGCEWPTVLLIGCNEGVIPSYQALKSNDIEGERRLMYVAITRAEDSLVLASRPTFSEGKEGREYHNSISRFMKEMIS